MSSILVTGGCGFVGANLLRILDDGTNELRVLDNLSMGDADDIDRSRVALFTGDIRDPSAVIKAVDGIETVVHLAAHTRVIESMEDPAENFAVNAKGTFNVLQACRRAGVSRVIFASTGGAIIGEVEPPVHEEMLPKPISPYGASKLAGEAYLSAFAGSYGIDTIALRFSNVYGPWSYNKGSVIAKYFKQILNGEELTVFGDGTQTRDFVYVEDLCHAIDTASKAEVHGFQIFNLGSGEETSVNELIRLIREVVGVAMTEVRYEEARRGEIYRNFARIDKARRVLSYSPSTSLVQGLQKTWDWFVQNQSRLTGS